MDDFKPLDLFGEGIVQKKATTESEDIDESVKESVVEDSSKNEKQDDKLSLTDDTTTDTEETDDNIINDNEDSSQCLPESSGAVLEKLGVIESFCQNFSTQLSDLEQLFSKRIMHADYEDKVIDQMHSELQKYKEDMYAQLVRPILLDIIEVRDSILRIAATYQSKPEGERDIPNKTFSDYSYDLQDILEKNNVEIYRSKIGDDFIPIRQRAMKKEVTHDESLHGKIAESLSCGYCYNGRVISAEKVSVYYYEKLEETKIESEENANG
ncbi:nucleotide exchange factor GrpE [Ruminococcus flavefaciens]|uniref:Molecular chaperone GrpE (Heat shock protein) n=1 Tax=Ruminococcus flavefaciens TaxID=1265 RepID=A0A1M7HTH0_RUMFL|nr:nucleotide exchange factor GrpE [Ruminococcus flavefaciens]SHM31633.1 Molecular chaperone GrpE (heat shock protein) [Ruminococcus flavefaciens]